MSAREDPPGDDLATYRAKRSPDRSPEPVGVVSSDQGRLFVVHKHAARNLHFDLRLEMEGVLRSWAVPRGPSYDPDDKRLAVKVEDHPIEYGDFEGLIPEGNYGAGAVIVWDRGEWVPLEDPRKGLEKGKLLFDLKGYKLHGRWTLVKIKKSERDWLLIKERDAWVKTPGTEFPEESVLSGLTVEELKTGHSPVAELKQAPEVRNVPKRTFSLDKLEVMKATPSDSAFRQEGWIFELKLDGYRLIAAKERGEPRLLTRNGNDYTAVFPEIARAVKALPLEDVVLDGEVVVLEPSGKPSFSLLQKRGRITRPIDIKRAAVELPSTYFAFDLLSFEDRDLRSLPLLERKALLKQVVPPVGPIRYLDHIETEGVEFLKQVAGIGLEGIIAKKADTPYKSGRSVHWLKIKTDTTGDFVIVGFTEPHRSRDGFGALQLADYVRGRLVYAGRAGTGFTDAQLGEIGAALADDVRATPPCYGPQVNLDGEPLPSEAIPETTTTTWVEPRLVCEVRYREWTPDGVLRHPAFLRLRDDKRPDECERQGSAAEPGEPEVEAAPLPATEKPPVVKTVTLSNLKKVFWPKEGYTKGDLVEYYRTIAPWILPYLKNRPLVLTRHPDGIEGKSFYQKDAPEFVPEWIETVPIWSEDTQRAIRYFVCNDEETLVYIANSGAIPLHIWASRVGSLELPDWCVVDLDPKEASFPDVVRVALSLHALCDEVGLPNYVKTTGKTGLHIMVPLGRLCTYEQSRTLGELLARLVIRDLGDVATIMRTINRRGEKVYIDYLQNRHGQLIVAPFSVRPLPGATVSMPLEWDEVDDELDQRRFSFTIKTALARMEALGTDPVRPVLEEKPDFALVLTKLGERFQAG